MKWTTSSLKQLMQEMRAQPGYAARTDLDQCPATAATVLRRARLLGRHNLDTLLLGDDDLLSIVLALTGARKRIVVLDADDMLLDRMRHVDTMHSIEFKTHDLRKGLPRSLRQRFNEVFTDPPYTLAGQLMFIHRALLALRPAGAASLYVCGSRLYLSRSDFAAVGAFLKQSGFRLAAQYPAFNRYAVPQDVRVDLEKLGRCQTRFDSDLFHYVRDRRARVPSLPKLNVSNIYCYPPRSPV